jgi:hypothetical protein
VACQEYEYRVYWARFDPDDPDDPDKARTYSKIYQTPAGARRKADAVMAMDAIKHETERWADMPDLVRAADRAPQGGCLGDDRVHQQGQGLDDRQLARVGGRLRRQAHGRR